MIKLNDFKVTGVCTRLPQNLIDSSMQLLKDMRVPEQWKKTKGLGIKVGVIDTGVDTNHKDLRHAIKGKFNSLDMSPNVEDTNGHGTHVAGLIASNGDIKGSAPLVDLYIVKALGDHGEGSDASLAAGIDWLMQQGVDIISMSLGAQENSKMVYSAVKRAFKKDIVCVCASGNDADGETITIDYPAAYKETIAVGAIDIEHQLAGFSSIGNVDLVCNGVKILSTYKNGTYAVLSGTSMSTPYISGCIALIQANAKMTLGRKLTISEIRMILALNCEDLGDIGKDIRYGYGRFTF